MLKPKCLTYKAPAFTAEGYFLPCCWVDRRNEYFKKRGFLNPELNVSNVDDITSEIFYSQPWIDFFNEIEYNQQDIPSVCIEHCGLNSETNRKVYYEPIRIRNID